MKMMRQTWNFGLYILLGILGADVLAPSRFDDFGSKKNTANPSIILPFASAFESSSSRSPRFASMRLFGLGNAGGGGKFVSL